MNLWVLLVITASITSVQLVASEAPISEVVIDILSQNVWLILTAPNKQERIPLIINGLIEKDYDIVCLQEVFTSTIDPADYVASFMEGLSDLYPYTVSNQPQPLSNGTFMDSGLLMFSKYPINSYSFHECGNSSGIDSLAGKGVMMAHIEIPADGTSLIVANTHFQAGRGIDEPEVRFFQSLELIGAVGKFKASLKNTEIPVFAVGDFNTDELQDYAGTSEEYVRLVQTLGAADLFRETNGDEPGYTNWGKSRLDYIFGLSGKYTLTDAGVEDFVNNTELQLSDHLGSYAIVKIPTGLNGVDSSSSSVVKWDLLEAFNLSLLVMIFSQVF